MACYKRTSWKIRSLLVALTMTCVLVVFYPNHRFQALVKQIRVTGRHLPKNLQFVFAVRPHDEENVTGRRVQLEIRFERGSLYREGIGGTYVSMRGALMFANATGAIITNSNMLGSGVHSYRLDKYLRFRPPLVGKRRSCNIPSRRLARMFADAVRKCQAWDKAVAWKVFEDCDTLHVRHGIGHPRQCNAYTAPLVRHFWKPLLPNTKGQDVCVLRRGGDIESRIEGRNATDFQWMIDENRTIPLLEELKRRGSRVVLITQSKFEERLRKRYRPDVLSNNEKLVKVMERVSRCQCLFVASGSSFALTVVQLAQPKKVIYNRSTKDRPFKYRAWDLHEFGERALVNTASRSKLIQACAPINNR